MAHYLALAFVVILAALSPAAAQGRGGDIEVDLQLVLAVDISYSMDPEEQRLQREGYIEAITSGEVMEAIKRGLIGKIAVTYLEWAGSTDQQVVIPWRIIEGPETARAFAAELQSRPYRRAFRTSISGALRASAAQFVGSGIRANRRVIDISGDGPNNNGTLVEPMRDEVLAQRITINGLPIMLRPPDFRTMDIGNLDEYYTDCVIGGPGAFMIPIKTRDEFVPATRRKLVMEIAGLDPTIPAFGDAEPRVIPVDRAKSDCLVGERMWRERWERN